MKTPKQVSDFAKEYKEMYIGLTQCKSAYGVLFKQLEDAKAKIISLEKELKK